MIQPAIRQHSAADTITPKPAGPPLSHTKARPHTWPYESMHTAATVRLLIQLRSQPAYPTHP